MLISNAMKIELYGVKINGLLTLYCYLSKTIKCYLLEKVR